VQKEHLAAAAKRPADQLEKRVKELEMELATVSQALLIGNEARSQAQAELEQYKKKCSSLMVVLRDMQGQMERAFKRRR